MEMKAAPPIGSVPLDAGGGGSSTRHSSDACFVYTGAKGAEAEKLTGKAARQATRHLSAEGEPAVRPVKKGGQPVRYPAGGRALCLLAAVGTPKLGERIPDPARGLKLTRRSGASVSALCAVGICRLSLEQREECGGACPRHLARGSIGGPPDPGALL